MKKSKRIRYRHVHALRDLSTCLNFNGVTIKKGVLFRSGYLGKLTGKEAKEFIEEFNIGYVIDLRTNAEKETAPDIYHEDIEYYHIPLLKDFDNPLVTKKNRNRMLIDIVKNKGGAIKYLSRVYRKMVDDEFCVDQISRIFNILLNINDDRAVIFHCSQGKDRTGVLAALILYALGVDKKSVISDYLRFNNAYKMKNFLISVVAAFRFFSFSASRDLYYIQMAHRKLIEATFYQIKCNFDNRYDFFREKIGLDGNGIIALRTKYLVKE